MHKLCNYFEVNDMIVRHNHLSNKVDKEDHQNVNTLYIGKKYRDIVSR